MENILVSAIVATDLGGVIGRDGEIPWNLSADLKRFKRLTLDCPLIMGRKTYESIGRPLPRRKNIVLTRSPEYEAPGCFVVSSIEQALKVASQEGPREIFIGGGQGVYEAMLPKTDRIYLTTVELRVPGDTHFVPLHPDGWEVVAKEDVLAKGSTPAYSFVDLVRRPEGPRTQEPQETPWFMPSEWRVYG